MSIAGFSRDRRNWPIVFDCRVVHTKDNSFLYTRVFRIPNRSDVHHTNRVLMCIIRANAIASVIRRRQIRFSSFASLSGITHAFVTITKNNTHTQNDIKRAFIADVYFEIISVSVRSKFHETSTNNFSTFKLRRTVQFQFDKSGP